MKTSQNMLVGPRRERSFAAIFWGGLFAGIFDLTQAFIGFGSLGATPYRILQHIAGGILGSRSYHMGTSSAAIGLVLHFTIAFTTATIYYLASRKMPALLENAVICGLLYGEAGADTRHGRWEKPCVAAPCEPVTRDRTAERTVPHDRRTDAYAEAEGTRTHFSGVFQQLGREEKDVGEADSENAGFDRRLCRRT
jgi:hypothetical protein